MLKKKCLEVYRLIKKVYEYHSCGGYAHIVFDDDNIENGNIDFCIKETKKADDISEQEKKHNNKSIRRI